MSCLDKVQLTDGKKYKVHSGWMSSLAEHFLQILDASENLQLNRIYEESAVEFFLKRKGEFNKMVAECLEKIRDAFPDITFSPSAFNQPILAENLIFEGEVVFRKGYWQNILSAHVENICSPDQIEVLKCALNNIKTINDFKCTLEDLKEITYEEFISIFPQLESSIEFEDGNKIKFQKNNIRPLFLSEEMQEKAGLIRDIETKLIISGTKTRQKVRIVKDVSRRGPNLNFIPVLKMTCDTMGV